MGTKPRAKANGGNRRAGLILLAIFALGAVALVGLAALAGTQTDAASTQGDDMAAAHAADEVNVSTAERAEVAQDEDGPAAGIAGAGQEDGALAALLAPIQQLLAQLVAMQ